MFHFLFHPCPFWLFRAVYWTMPCHFSFPLRFCRLGPRLGACTHWTRSRDWFFRSSLFHLLVELIFFCCRALRTGVTPRDKTPTGEGKKNRFSVLADVPGPSKRISMLSPKEKGGEGHSPPSSPRTSFSKPKLKGTAILQPFNPGSCFVLFARTPKPASRAKLIFERNTNFFEIGSGKHKIPIMLEKQPSNRQLLVGPSNLPIFDASLRVRRFQPPNNTFLVLSSKRLSKTRRPELLCAHPLGHLNHEGSYTSRAVKFFVLSRFLKLILDFREKVLLMNLNSQQVEEVEDNHLLDHLHLLHHHKFQKLKYHVLYLNTKEVPKMVWKPTCF